MSQPLSRCLTEALKHFDAGRNVVPCNGKKPVGTDWGNAWRDRAKLAEYFGSHPDANLGLVMGEVIDIESDTPEQEEAFHVLFAGSDVPRTPCFSSTRGKHYFFKADARLTQLGEGVINYKKLGVRIGAGGKQVQSVIPPSTNDDNTQREWEVSFDDCVPADLPEGVVDRILASMKPARTKASSPSSTVATRVSITRAKAAIKRIKKDSGDGSRRLVAWACRAVEFGLSDAEALGAIRDCEQVLPFPRTWTDLEIIRRVRDAEKMVKRGSAGIKKPEINITRNDLDKLTQQTWDAIREANQPPQLFLFGGPPVRVERIDGDEPLVRVLQAAEMRFHLAEWVHFFRSTEKDPNIVCAPPMHIVNNILATPEKPLPYLDRIVEAPVFGSDGTLQTTPGYHPASKTLFLPKDGFEIPTVPDMPSTEDIAAARELIVQEMLGDFPFVNESEKAHAVGLALLFFARKFIDGPTPFHLFEKPSPGTGATLLVEVLAYLAVGRLLAGMTEGRDEDEWRKRLTSKLRTSPAFVLVDNLGSRLDSPAVASAITAQYWEDRILGTSQVAKFPVRCAWIGTGNNPSLSTEMVRRTVRIRLDAGVDCPWTRAGFRHPNLKGWVAENRSRLVWAALTLIRAWLTQGRPDGDKTLGMFEDWARVMGGILEVAGVPGFMANREKFYEDADTDGAALRGFLAVWWARRGTEPTRTAELVPIAQENAAELLGTGTDHSQVVRLGKSLSDAKDRVFNVQVEDSTVALRIEAAGTKARAALWQLSLAA